MIEKFILIILALAVFSASITVIYFRHENRMAFIQLQQLQQQRDELNEQWGQLQLEFSTLTQHQRIENLAKNKLNMHAPNLEETVFLRP